MESQDQGAYHREQIEELALNTLILGDVIVLHSGQHADGNTDVDFHDLIGKRLRVRYMESFDREAQVQEYGTLISTITSIHVRNRTPRGSGIEITFGIVPHETTLQDGGIIRIHGVRCIPLGLPPAMILYVDLMGSEHLLEQSAFSGWLSKMRPTSVQVLFWD